MSALISRADFRLFVNAHPIAVACPIHGAEFDSAVAALGTSLEIVGTPAVTIDSAAWMYFSSKSGETEARRRCCRSRSPCRRAGTLLRL